MLGLESMQAPGSSGSQRAQGLEQYVFIYLDFDFHFFVPASTATHTRTILYIGIHGVADGRFLR